LWHFGKYIIGKYIIIFYTQCSNKKGATKLVAVTSSNLNRFSKFFYRWKAKEIYNKNALAVGGKVEKLILNPDPELISSKI